MARPLHPAPNDAGLSALRRSLTRQSLLVGAAAAAVDAAIFALSGIFATAPLPATLVVVLLIAADLALGAPPATVARVAVVQVLARLAACWLLNRHGLAAGIGDVGILVAGYRAGAWLADRVALAVVPLLVVGVSAAALLNGAADGDWRMLAMLAISNGVLPWLVGRYTATGGAYVTELEQRGHKQRAAMERALADEREAIARDLHDVISHHVSAIGIHAGAARMALAADPEAASRSLAAVESSTRAAMVDLRRQLDLLHGRADAGNRQPGLANLAELVDSVRAAGLAVDVDLPTGATELPQSLDVTLYRIAQELLTNALRHGDGTARLTVRQTPGEVLVEATNPVARQPYSGDSLHRGVDGIRRRAELFGGTVESGQHDGHWRTAISLPIGAP